MQCVSYLLAVDLYGLAVVVEHGRHVLIRYPEIEWILHQCCAVQWCSCCCCTVLLSQGLA